MGDRERGLQFFRWKERVAANPRRPASVGDAVPAITHGFSQRYTTLKPYFPVGTIPPDTLDHIQSVQRVNPLGEDARSRLIASEGFTLDILEDLKPSTTFRCRIRSIDGKDMASSPDLCVKFFDDRLFPMDPPEPTFTGLETRLWWRGWASSEDYVRNEDATYKRLSMAQGSLVPFYYGAHLFTLPNGDQLFGILMEYVQAPPLMQSSAGSLTEDQRAEFVRSVRHALRLLDRADVSQHDWHACQLLLLRSPHVHCVLIGFARTSISVKLENHASDDFGHVLARLVDSKIGLGEQVVLRNFGEREVWDVGVQSTVWDNGKFRWMRSKDPFSFVYERNL